MSKCNCIECNPYGEPEPDQIDMMDADELRTEFRALLKQRDELREALCQIATGKIIGQPHSHKAAILIMRQIANEAIRQAGYKVEES
jgi:hypothetical protein